jgi:predicted permease
MEAIARVAPRATMADVQRELDALTGRLGVEFAATNRGWRTHAIALHEEVVGHVRVALFVVLTAVGLLLLVACINIASLLMARATSRAREVAVRAAIGATRRRLVVQFLTESLLLSVVGGLLGVCVAVAAVRGIVAATPVDIPRLADVGVDGQALGFALALVLSTAIVFGLLPAIVMSRVDLNRTLKEGGRSPGAHGGRRTHKILVAAEVALAAMLLAGAGLLTRSVVRLAADDPGFRPANVTTAGIQLSGSAYASWSQVEQFHSALVQSLRQQPGIDAAGASNFLPLTPGWRIPFLIRGLPAPPRGDEPTAQYHSVSEGYFEALGVPLLRGRLFDSHDTAQSRGVVVINQTLARRYFGDVDPIGRTLASLATNIGPLGMTLMKDRDHVIIGVVGDVKNSSLRGTTEAALYHTVRQFPFRHLYVVARGADPANVGAAIRDVVRRSDPGLPLPELQTMEAVVGESLEQPRLLMFMLGVFASAALALSALGIYGLLSYAVAERQQELSIRLALGARPAGVRWLVVRDGMGLALAGSIAGVFIAYLIARQVASVLYGVRPGDPVALGTVVIVALASAMAACLIPAWRASRIDPLAGLKD